MKILVTGGAGYIGSVLTRQLLNKGFKVKVLDKLMFGGDALVDFFNNPNFEFQKGDIRIEKDLEMALEGIDAVAHLAAIVGDPACALDTEITKSINVDGAKLLYNLANKKGVKKFIFSSTCSNYGKMEDPNSFVNEDSKLAPVSLYAETKVEIEKFLLSQNKENVCKPTCLRFSTVYGASPRMRFDLTVNEFTKELAQGKELIIFGEQFWRPYCHVEDLARSVNAIIDADKSVVAFDVFNVGDTSENYQKQMIVNEISKQITDTKIKFVEKNEDPRDYRVSFNKIKTKLGFEITKTVPEGIKQVKEIIMNNVILDPDNSKYKNI